MNISLRKFKPTYGYGWRQGNHSIDVPELFSVVVQTSVDSHISGIVQAPHRYSGCLIDLSFRGTSDGANNWSLVISGGSLEENVTGFAQSI